MHDRTLKQWFATVMQEYQEETWENNEWWNNGETIYVVRIWTQEMGEKGDDWQKPCWGEFYLNK